MKCAGHSHALPAHHKPLQSSKRLRIMRRRSFLQVGSFVRGGEWECQSLNKFCASYETRCKSTKKTFKGQKYT